MKVAKTYCLTFLESSSPRSRCQQDWFPPRAMRKLCSSAPAGAGGLWRSGLVEAPPQPRPSSSPGALSTCLLLRFPFLKDPSHIGFALSFLVCLPLQRPHLQVRLHSEVRGVRNSSYEFQRNTILTHNKQEQYATQSVYVELCVCVCVCSVMSDSLRPHGLSPTRLLCPWDFPGKTTGVDCHFLLQGIFPIQGLNPCFLYLLHWQADSFFIF